jgi:phosphoglucosamine mutase
MRHLLFGTDGIRGEANRPPMTVETGVALGRAIAHGLRHGKAHPKILIGKDTRLSCYLFENALAAGICAVGGDAYLMGPMPTPGVAFLTLSMRAEAGVMISASHNPYQDNGIKFFGRDGFKLNDELEEKIATWVQTQATPSFDVTGDQIGKAFRVRDVLGRYVVYLKSTFPQQQSLEGLRICVDCAHGAAYKLAPMVLEELGAEVIPMGVEPNGININDQQGALYPQKLKKRVLESGAHIGIALDGDADRCILVDEKGKLIDGDRILGMSALWMKSHDQLQGNTVVATVMTNLGLEKALDARGIAMARCAVGDRFVVQSLREKGLVLGGEQSGHLIYLNHATTGDGMLTALQVLAQMLDTGKPLSELAGFYEPLPQVVHSLRVDKKVPLAHLDLTPRAIAESEARLGGDGRIVVRYSGTEKKVRVMVEATDSDKVKQTLERISEALISELGGGI